MRQKSSFPPPLREHGGILSVGKRRARRTLTTRQSLHLTLRSDLAINERSLLRHQDIVLKVMKKAERRFRIKVYQLAINGNHLHFLARGKTRLELQNFFRVLAGHIAQQILIRCPLTGEERKQSKARQKGCQKNVRKFWALLLYSRIVSWGREFSRVSKYIWQNTLEALDLIAYQPRKKRRDAPS